MHFDIGDIRMLIRMETRRTGNPLHDEDLEQDTALKAVQAFRRETNVRYPRAFLMKIVRDAVRDHWRRKHGLPAQSDLDALQATHFTLVPRPEDDLDRRAQAGQLRDALLRIDSAKRITLEMFYAEERPISEIARLQGRSVSAVKMELMRTRRALAEMVGDLPEKKSR